RTPASRSRPLDKTQSCAVSQESPTTPLQSGRHATYETPTKRRRCVRNRYKNWSDGVGAQDAVQVSSHLGCQARALLGVLLGQHVALGVQPADQVAAIVGQQHVDLDLRPGQLCL